MDLPKNVAQKNGPMGTPIIGDDILVNQFGISGVMRRNMRYQNMSS